MSLVTQPEFWNEIRDDVKRQLIDLARSTARDMQNKEGLVYRQEKSVPMDVILSVIDLHERGVLPNLKVVSLRQYERLMTEYRNALKTLGMQDAIGV